MVEIRPRRGRCRSCGKTQVLLADVVLGRRVDTVAVIGRALRAAGDGAGHRKAAEVVGRPVSTVRGWLRRFRAVTERVAAHFTVWARTAFHEEVAVAGPEVPGHGGHGRLGVAEPGAGLCRRQ